MQLSLSDYERHLTFVHNFLVSFTALGYGVDPSLEVNFLEAIALKSSTATGIRQVPGYISEEPAYELEGTPSLVVFLFINEAGLEYTQATEAMDFVSPWSWPWCPFKGFPLT